MIRWLLVAGTALAAAGVLGVAWAQQHDHSTPGASSAPGARPAGAKAPLRVDMHELHGAGGVPPGWRFSWPDGDARKGREVFAKLECYQCHEVKGESFPAVVQDPARRGPALSGMGDRHPAEYFAESILSPNAVIVAGTGHTGADGLSIMPDFRDSLTLAETIDLVAYIRSLTGGEHANHHPTATEREQVVGGYRIRLAYTAHQRHGGAARPPAAHLMVFVTDIARGEPMPYLPVKATIHAKPAAPRAVLLVPMLGAKGFHYGADLTLPAGTTKITVAIGTPGLRVMPTETARVARGAEVSFEWGK